MRGHRSFKAYLDEDMESILSRLNQTAKRLNIKPEELVVKAFAEDPTQIPQKTYVCPTIDQIETLWPDTLTTHISNCFFCQVLVKAVFPVLSLEASSDIFNEIKKVEEHFVGKCPSCYFLTEPSGHQVFFPIPLRNQLDHVQKCLFCQFLIHCLREERRNGLSCLGIKGWQVYPLFHPKDLHYITEHVIKECRCPVEKCNQWATVRFRFNALRDRDQYQQLKRRSVNSLRRQIWVNRNIKKPVGDFISLHRFESNPFCNKHSWSVWGIRDGLFRLLTSDNLSLEETLYKELLDNPEKEQEMVNRLTATFTKYEPRDWTYNLPDRPLLWNRRIIIEFLRLEDESQKRGITVKELKVIEAEEDRKTDEEIMAKLEERGQL